MIPFTRTFEFGIGNASIDSRQILSKFCSKYQKSGFIIERKKSKLRIGIPLLMYVQTWQFFGWTDSIEIGFKCDKGSVIFTYTYNVTSFWIFSIGLSVLMAFFADSVLTGFVAFIVIGAGNYGLISLQHNTHYLELKKELKTCYNNTYTQCGLKE